MLRRRRASVTLGLVMLLASSGLSGSAAGAQQDVSLLNLNGGSVALSSLRGKVVVLLFSGIQDPQCRDEFRALASLADRYRDKDVAIFWVSVNPPNAATDDRLKNPCGPAGEVTVLRDQTQAAFKRFSGAVPQLPTTVIISKQGQPHGQPRGGFNPGADFVNDIAAAIDTLLK